MGFFMFLMIALIAFSAVISNPTWDNPIVKFIVGYIGGLICAFLILVMIIKMHT